jgi:hypothetical protein
MAEIKLIDTEIGRIPVVIRKIKQEGESYYTGMVLGENNIFIQTKTEAFCIDQLRKAFELSMHFWVRHEISDLKLKYEGKVSKQWYNEW